MSAVIIAIFAGLIILGSTYQEWDYSDSEKAVIGVAFHAFEWVFFRVAPIIFIGAIVGIILTRKKHNIEAASVAFY